MKFNLLKNTVISIVFSLSSAAHAGLISSSEYSLDSMNGPWHGGFNNWTSGRDIDNVNERSAVEVMLSDGATNLISGSNGVDFHSQTTDIDKFTGIYTSYHDGSSYELVFALDGQQPYTLDGISMESSRAFDFMFNSALYVSLDGIAWTEILKGPITSSLQYTHGSNGHMYLGEYSFTSVAANYVKYSTTRMNGSLHEISLFGESQESQEVPEPSTLAIFALGMIGLASRRFKKQ
jgi:hypothetical protein